MVDRTNIAAVRILLMPVRALRPNIPAAQFHHGELRQNPINARKGITTECIRSVITVALDRQNPINARKGITTFVGQPCPTLDLIGQNPINARKGITTL